QVRLECDAFILPRVSWTSRSDQSRLASGFTRGAADYGGGLLSECGGEEAEGIRPRRGVPEERKVQRSDHRAPECPASRLWFRSGAARAGSSVRGEVLVR